MKNILAFCFLAVLVKSACADNCLAYTCKVGDSVITQHSKNDWGYNCPTKELAEYTAFIRGIWAVQSEMFGQRPNIDIESNATGKTAAMISSLRSAARVGSYDEAASRCVKGKSGVVATIVEKPSDSVALKVQPLKGEAFWTMEGFVYHSSKAR